MIAELPYFLTFIVTLSWLSALLVFKKPISVLMFGWFFIPNTSADIVSISNIPISLYAQIIFLCFSFFLYRNKKNVGVLRPLQLSRIGNEKIFYFLLIVTFFTTYMLFPFHFSFPDHSFNPSLETLVTDQNKMSSYLSHMLSELVGILYLFFLMRFVNTKKDIEEILIFLVSVVIIIFLEFLLVSFVSPLNQVLGDFSFSPSSAFLSVFLNDYDVVCLMAIFGALSSLYFYFENKKSIWLLVYTFSAFLILISLQRTALLSLAAGSAIILYFSYLRYKNIFFQSSVFALGISMIVVLLSPQATDLVTGLVINNIEIGADNSYAAGRVIDFASSDSTFVRFGQQLRSLEVIAYFFPLGLGADQLQWYLNSNTGVPPIFLIEDPGLHVGYDRVAHNGIYTNSHNGYIEQVASFGLVGLITMIFIIFCTLKTIMNGIISKHVNPNLFALYAGLAFALGVYFFFLAYPRIYIIFYFLVHLGFLIDRFLENDRQNKLI